MNLPVKQYAVIPKFDFSSHIRNRYAFTGINDRKRGFHEIKFCNFSSLMHALITVITQPHLADLTHKHVVISGA